MKTKQSATKKKNVRVRRRGRETMPAALYNHLRMVADPCNSPLAETVYPNAAGVFRSRSRRTFTSSHTPATTAGAYARVIAWHPVIGAFNLGSAGSNTFPLASALETFNSYQELSRYSQNSSTAVFSARAVSGCLSMAWNGKELDRAGMVYSGVVNGGLIYNALNTGGGGAGQVTPANTLAALLANTCRTPNDRCEVTWVPTEWDANWSDPFYGLPSASTGALQDIFNKVNFAVMIWIGSQEVGQTVTFMETAVAIVEENPNTGLYVQDAAHVSTTGIPNGVTKIVSILQKRDTSWYVNTFKKLGQLGLTALSAYARGGALGLVSEVAGLAVAPRKNLAA